MLICVISRLVKAWRQQIGVATGESPKGTDTKEKPIVSIQELTALAWVFPKEYKEVNDIMNALGTATKEYAEINIE